MGTRPVDRWVRDRAQCFRLGRRYRHCRLRLIRFLLGTFDSANRSWAGSRRSNNPERMRWNKKTHRVIPIP